MPNLLPIIIVSSLLGSHQEPAKATKDNQPPQGELFSQREIDAVKQMQKVIDPIISNYINAELKFYEAPETAMRVAKIKHSLYKSLLKVGFSKSEAIQIVANTHIPSITISSK